MIELRMAGKDGFDRLASELEQHVSASDPLGRLLDDGAERLSASFCYVLAMQVALCRTGRPAEVLDGLGPGRLDGGAAGARAGIGRR